MFAQGNLGQGDTKKKKPSMSKTPLRALKEDPGGDEGTVWRENDPKHKTLLGGTRKREGNPGVRDKGVFGRAEKKKGIMSYDRSIKTDKRGQKHEAKMTPRLKKSWGVCKREPKKGGKRGRNLEPVGRGKQKPNPGKARATRNDGGKGKAD